MSTCQIHTGIFVQRTCGKSAPHTCDSCLSAVCEEHRITDESGQTFCPECAPHPVFDNNKVDEHVIDRNSFGLWYWSTRSSYYSQSHTEAVFNAEDLSGFEYQEFGDNDLGTSDTTDDFFDS